MELTHKRVLIVEDEAMLARLMSDLLESMGCEVVGVASHLPDALERAGSASFDFATLDLNLRGSLSYPVATLLRERGIPFLFATGYAVPLPAEFKDVQLLVKPFSRNKLESVALEVLCSGAARQDPGAPPSVSTKY